MQKVMYGLIAMCIGIGCFVPSIKLYGMENAIQRSLEVPKITASDFFKRRSLPADLWVFILNSLDHYDRAFRYAARYVPISEEKAQALVDDLDWNITLRNIHGYGPSFDLYNWLEDMKKLLNGDCLPSRTRYIGHMGPHIKELSSLMGLSYNPKSELMLREAFILLKRKPKKEANKSVAYFKIREVLQRRVKEAESFIDHMNNIIASTTRENESEKRAAIHAEFLAIVKRKLESGGFDKLTNFLITKLFDRSDRMSIMAKRPVRQWTTDCYDSMTHEMMLGTDSIDLKIFVQEIAKNPATVKKLSFILLKVLASLHAIDELVLRFCNPAHRIRLVSSSFLIAWILLPIVFLATSPKEWPFACILMAFMWALPVYYGCQISCEDRLRVIKCVNHVLRIWIKKFQILLNSKRYAQIAQALPPGSYSHCFKSWEENACGAVIELLHTTVNPSTE